MPAVVHSLYFVSFCLLFISCRPHVTSKHWCCLSSSFTRHYWLAFPCLSVCLSVITSLEHVIILQVRFVVAVHYLYNKLKVLSTKRLAAVMLVTGISTQYIRGAGPLQTRHLNCLICFFVAGKYVNDRTSFC